jgi:5-methylcytosine-specific restriction endonuclease McrA
MWFNQKQRAKKHGAVLDYTVEDLRRLVEDALRGACPYCLASLHVQNFGCDHEVPISRGGSWRRENLVICCRNCNEAKGPLTGEEFIRIVQLLLTLPVPAKLNVIKRLRAGGRAIYGN